MRLLTFGGNIHIRKITHANDALRYPMFHGIVSSIARGR